jgi:hypothetical protein
LSALRSFSPATYFDCFMLFMVFVSPINTLRITIKFGRFDMSWGQKITG